MTVHPAPTRPTQAGHPDSSSGQVISRHPPYSAYRCSLPGLTGFTERRCVRPGHRRQTPEADPISVRLDRDFDLAVADCELQGTAISPSSTITTSVTDRANEALMVQTTI